MRIPVSKKEMKKIRTFPESFLLTRPINKATIKCLCDEHMGALCGHVIDKHRNVCYTLKTDRDCLFNVYESNKFYPREVEDIMIGNNSFVIKIGKISN